MSPTSDPPTTPPPPHGVSRRDVIRRIAIAGGAAWTLPAIQTVNMQRAYALTGSPTRTCYSVYIAKHYGCRDATALDPNAFKCLKGKVEHTVGACDFVGVSIDPYGDGRWFVTLVPGCQFVAGFSGTHGGACIPSPTPAGSTGIIEFDPGKGGAPKDQITHVELTFCRLDDKHSGVRPTKAAQPGGVPGAPPPTLP